VTGLATLGGPLVGGAVTQGLAWQWIFWLNVPLGLLLIPLVRGRIDESFGTDVGLDVPGLALSAAGALGLVWGLVRGNVVGWGSAEVVGSLAAGVLLVAAFVAWEARAREPMLPLRYFRLPAFSSGNAASFLLYGSIFGAAFMVPQFLQVSLHYGPLGAGLRLAPWTVTLFLVAPIAGARVSRIGERPLVVGGLVLQAAGLAWLALIARPDLAYPAMVAPLVVSGVGVSMAMPAVQNAVVGAVPRPAIGKASGTFNTLRQLGGTFGIAIVATAFAAAGGYASPQAFSDGFARAIGVTAALSLAAAAAGLRTPGRRVAVPAVPPAARTPVLAERGE
jgi:MFS family permease